MAEALLHENRAVSDLEDGVRLPHSDEQDPFRAFRFLVPSRLEGMWGVVDGKAGGLADARHIHSPPEKRICPQIPREEKNMYNKDILNIKSYHNWSP